MSNYDWIAPLKPEQWIKNKSWLINRCLFLLFLKERNNERFYGGDYDMEDFTGDMPKVKTENSFSDELRLIEELHPEQMKVAFDIWIDADVNGQIPFVEVK